MESLKLLLQIYIRPAQAMSDIMDRGSWVFAAVFVLAIAAAFYATINVRLDEAYAVTQAPDISRDIDQDSPQARADYEKVVAEYHRSEQARPRIPLVGDRFLQLFSIEPSRFYEPIFLLSIFYVPGVILLMSLMGGTGNFGIALRRDYGILAVCTLMAWAAANLPFASAGLVLYFQSVTPQVYLTLWLASGLLFGFFMVFALRTALGANYMTAMIAVSIAWIFMSAGMYVFRHVSPLLFSPFLLFWAVIYFGGFLRGEARGFGNSFRQRQNFKRFLHNATVNPKDADAHVQLALIYLQRRQETKALEHLHKAIEIDYTEIDANYELGKIARKEGKLQEAIDHFSIVVEQNDKHSLSEIWREIGATYMEAGMLNEARDALEKFVDRRSIDPEGLYYLGKVLKQQGDTDRARELFEQAIESARTSPDFRHGNVRYWSRLAQKEI
jgi:tetratricopeptide (TPR) repeat protein